MIVVIDKLSRIRKNDNQKKIGFAAGTFDLLHIGHLQYLNWAKRHCDVLVVYVRSDLRVCSVKKRMPYNGQQDRALLVDSLKAVDFTVIGEKVSSKIKPSIEIARRLRPDIIFVGANWATEEAAWRKNIPGAEVLLSPTPHIKSSTQILLDNKLLDS